LLWPLLSTASAAALDLSWTAPAGCPDQKAVEERLEALLGTHEKPADLRAALRVEALRSGYKLSLVLDGKGARGTRELTGSDCAALAETGAWLVATAIDPGLTLLPPPPAPEPPPPPEPAPAPPALPPVSTPPPKPPSPWALHAAVHGGLVQWMERPRAQGALGFALGGSWRRLLAELRADLGVPSRSSILSETTLESIPTKTSSQALSLAACGLWGGWLRAGPCLSLSGTRTRAHAELSTGDRGAKTLYWMEAFAGAQIAARIAWPIELFMEGGVGTPVSKRPQFEVTTPHQNLSATRATGYGRLGLRFRWPISPSARR
jgi:hypothetical protein